MKAGHSDQESYIVFAKSFRLRYVPSKAIWRAGQTIFHDLQGRVRGKNLVRFDVVLTFMNGQAKQQDSALESGLDSVSK